VLTFIHRTAKLGRQYVAKRWMRVKILRGDDGLAERAPMLAQVWRSHRLNTSMPRSGETTRVLATTHT
jgi:hypothetical protein